MLIIPFSAYAEETEVTYDEETYQEYLSAYDLSVFEKELDDNTYSLLRELGVEDFNYESITDLTLDSAFGIIAELIKGKLKSPVEGVLAVLVYIILAALFQSMKSEGSAMSDTYSTVSALIISVVLVVKISAAVSLAAYSIGLAADFIYAFIPIFCSIVIASGGITTSFSTNSMLLMLSQGLSAVSSNIFMPMINCFLALGICSSLRSELNLSGIVSSMKKIITGLLSFSAGAFVSVLSLKTTVSARADILGIRSLRFVINSVVPVVGGAISEGLLSIQSYSSLIKSSVGIVGIIAVALVFLPSVVEVLLWRLMLSLCAIICDIFGDKNVSLVIKAFADSMLLINVVLIISAMTTIISIGILIAAGGN